MTQALDALTLPLTGSRLIEASAGTGKTWTIASIYLRLVLGHGTREPGGTAFERPLAPSEILVMTFTRAATRELSDRIRTRLTSAARCFRAESKPEPHDRLLAGLIADHADSDRRLKAAWLLEVAAQAMDDAAVLTIDAWCQRMLGEHAFDTGNAFDETLIADESALLQEAARDYWRMHCYPLNGAQLDAALSLWNGPADLCQDAAALIRESSPEEASDPTLAVCIDRAIAERQQRLRALSDGWVARAQAMREWLDAQRTDFASHWVTSKLQPRHYHGWLDTLAAWAQAPGEGPPVFSDTAKQRLTPAGLLEIRATGAPDLLVPDCFAAFEQLLSALEHLPSIATALRMHAAAHVGQRLAALKVQTRSFSFADIGARLERALTGPNGERLRARIRAQYPVALIDEFQDTSPLQYRLFDAIYRCADNDATGLLLLIGDPKQSIYRFRGADIYSYLRARRATAGRLHTLDTNYRSSRPMVEAVNTWFSLAEARTPPADRSGEPDGAFLFRHAQDNPVPFEPARANGRPERFRSAGGTVPALTIHHDLELRARDDSMRVFAQRCAQRIVTWLNDEATGFDDPNQGFTRLRPADIAILVRTGIEASTVRRELRQRGIASVYLSERDSVFASDQAIDLLRWLRAVASPADARLARAALATRTIGLTIETLTRLADNDEAFDTCLERLRALNAVWRERGVLAMVRRTLHDFDLPARWLAEADGERRLTNLLHLAELLQNASVELDGEQALIRWLASRIEDDAEAHSDEHLLRLESDADLIRVVTIHKSKGLEYPVVCLPFAGSVRPIDDKARLLSLVDESGAPSVRLDFDRNDVERADRERLREDLRLFYVALTRARHAVWLGFGAIRVGQSRRCVSHLSAAGHLLGGPGARDESDWLEPLRALASRSHDQGEPCIALEAASDRVDRTQLARAESLPRLRETPPFQARFERWWATGSYSALVRGVDEPIRGPLDVQRRALDEGRETTDIPRREQEPESHAPWHRFPGGPANGDFVHGLLEWLASRDFALAGNPALQSALRERCRRAGRGDVEEAALLWMQALLATPLPSVGVALPALSCRLTEMEFWMPATHLRASDIDSLCSRELLGSTPRPALPPRALNGMLMGFADLVFEHEGRYWVLDYKTNRLGREALAYNRAGLEAEMARHRYDVQAAIYLLALHRLLRARLGNTYQPSRQLGGAIYWFVRGIDSPLLGEYAIPANPSLLSLIDAMDRLLINEDPAA